ncbi:MAG TPA: 6,7-dimethyl-8-ribityllumazine synthase [Phycisphaerales bacterium]|nr:6,7-dimethyl-8-ribityllumazine synthase [Phycisphaerales bacterium]
MANEPTNLPALPPREVARVAVVVSRYNDWITDRLLDGAVQEHARRAHGAGSVEVLRVPGSFELPAVARAAASSGRYDAVVALGCLIRGETVHDRVIADAVAHGIMSASCDTGVAIGFGVLTVENAEQAEQRAGGEMGNKGAEAMAAALDAAGVLAALKKAGHR